jgi:hypothetical protein
MQIELFDFKEGVVVPTVHCETIQWLKNIQKSHPTSYMKVYMYLYYMSAKTPKNPFVNTLEEELEETVLSYIDADFSTEDKEVRYALDQCKKLYETATSRAYIGIKNMLDKLAVYMDTQTITDGRDGNITAIVNAAKNFDSIRKSFKGIEKDLIEEQTSRARGGTTMAYDQI